MRLLSKWLAYGVLVAVLLGCAAEAVNVRAINLPLGKLGRYDEHQVLMADVFFKDERIPRFGGVPSFFSIAFFFAYCCKRGYGVSIVACVLFALLYFIEYLIVLSVVDQDSIARYGLLNPRPILTNRGALGGPYFALYFFGLVGLAAGIGCVLSGTMIDEVVEQNQLGEKRYRKHQRSYYLIDCSNHCGRGGTRCIDGCAKLNDDRWTASDDNGQLALESAEKLTAAACSSDGGEFDTGIAQACAATAPGDVIGFGVFVHFVGLITLFALATGPMADIWSNPEWYGFVLLGLAIAFTIIMLSYPFYRYGKRIDYPTAVTRVRKRCQQRVWFFFEAMLVLVPFYVAAFIYFFVMGSLNAYGLIKFAIDAEEARYLAYQNVLSELVVLLSVAFFIWLVTRLVYCWVLNRAPPVMSVK